MPDPNDDSAFDLLCSILGASAHRPFAVPVEADWDTVFQLAGRHRVGPVLARGIVDGAVTGVPDHAHRHAKTIRQRTALDAERRRRHYRRFEAACRDADIPVRQFKGEAVSAWAYPDAASRNVGDLDILVRPGDVAAADRITEDLGYQPFKRESVRPGAVTAMFLRSRSVLEYRHGVSGIHFDLHWRWTRNPFHMPFDEACVWREDDDMFRAEMAIYLCVHGGSHGWCRLKWLVDIHRLCAGHAAPAPDWDLVRARARVLGASRWVELALYLAREHLGSPVPDWVTGRNCETLIEACRAQMIAAQPSGDTPQGWEALRWVLSGNETMARRWRIIAHDVVTPSAMDMDGFAWTGRRAIALYPLRPVLWIWRRFRRRSSAP